MKPSHYTPFRLALLGALLVGSLALMGWFIVSRMDAARQGRAQENAQPREEPRDDDDAPDRDAPGR